MSDGAPMRPRVVRPMMPFSALSALCWSGAYVVSGWLSSAQIHGAV
jgi:hypothetical protein